MNLLLVLAAITALCAGSAIPVVPRDNSHYIDGESRYIWMSDGKGDLTLVDLQEPVDEALVNEMTRNGADNQYWLYTRNNPTTPQIIWDGDTNSIWNSNYQSWRATKVIVHGWNNDGNSEINQMIRDAFLAVGDFNVIVVDWRALADSNYVSATAGVPSVGTYIASFLQWLYNNAGGDWANTHLVGYSLGGHVVGNAGRYLFSGTPVRITALDPAGPLWSGNIFALRPSDGVFVEAIHTDSTILGLRDPVGDADFYPNGGSSQPGCIINTCSHSRSYQYFASSVRTDHFVGYRCDNLDQASSNNCWGATLNMGNSHLWKRGNGLYAMTTGRTWPF